MRWIWIMAILLVCRAPAADPELTVAPKGAAEPVENGWLLRGGTLDLAPFPIPGKYGETTLDLEFEMQRPPLKTVRLIEIGAPETEPVAWFTWQPDGRVAAFRRFLDAAGNPVVREVGWFAGSLAAGRAHHLTAGVTHTWKGYVYWIWLDGRFAAQWMNPIDPGRDGRWRWIGPRAALTVRDVRLREGTHLPAKAPREFPEPTAWGKAPLLPEVVDMFLYCPFDGDAKTTAGPFRLASGPETPEFVSGVVGQALRLGPGNRWRNEGDVLRYDVSGLAAERGTIAAWFRFDGWEPADHGTVLFNGPYPLQLYVYKTRRTMPLVYARRGERRVGVELGRFGPPFPGEADRWLHVAVTWTAPRIAVYVNGRLFNEGRMRIEGDELDAVGGGFGEGQQLELVFPQPTSVDELVVLPTGLFPDEVAALYGRYVGRPAPDGPPRPTPFFQLSYAPGLEQVQPALIDLAKAGLRAPAEVRLSVTDAAGKEIVDPLEFRLGTARGAGSRVQLPRPLAPGAYDVRIEARDGDRKAVDTVRFHRRPIDWLEHPVAAEPRLLRPWLPVGSAGHELSAWGRTWHCDRFWLPEQITVLQEEPTLGSRIASLLAAPMRIEARIDGRDVVLDGKGKVTDRAPHEVGVRGVAKHRGVVFEHRGTLEFDGSFHHRLTLKRRLFRRVSTVESLRLVIPLRSEVARYFHVVPDRLREVQRSGAVPAGEGTVWGSLHTYWGEGGVPVRERWGAAASSEWTGVPGRATPRHGSLIPYVWLGNEDRGLAWWTHTDRGWVIDPAIDAIRMQRTGDAVELVINFIQAPLTVDTPRTVGWSVTPTPCRPRPPNWRQWLATTTLYGASSRWARACMDVAPSQWYLDKCLAGGAGDGNPAVKRSSTVHYADIRSMGAGTPEAAYFASTWQPGKAVNPSPRHVPIVQYIEPARFKEYTNHDPRAYGSTLALPVPSNRDFRAACLDRLIRDCGWNGIYLDDTYLFALDWPAHGLGYTLPDGTRQPEYTMLLWREATRRYHAVFEAHDIVWPRIVPHCTNAVMVSSLGFCPVSYVAEWGNHEDCRDLLEKYNPDVMRASCIGRNLGFVPTWHGVAHTASKDKEAEARRETATLLLHDVWRFRPRGEADQLRHQWAKGEQPIEFHPYWASPPRVVTDHQSVLASAYHCAGETILTVVNYLDTAHATTVAVPAAWLTGRQLADDIRPTDDTLTLTVPPRDARILIIR